MINKLLYFSFVNATKHICILAITLFLVSCFNGASERSATDNQSSIVIVEVTNWSQAPSTLLAVESIDGVEQLSENKTTLLLSTNAEVVDVDELMATYRSKDCAVTKNTVVKPAIYESNTSTKSSHKFSEVQLPDFSFPNIFKALIVIYK